MFEMSLVESSGALKSRSSRYLWITGAFNATVVALMIVVPLFHPEALPKSVLTSMLSAPLPPAAPPATPKPVAARDVKPVAALDPYTAPTRVPKTVSTVHDDPPPATADGVVGMNAMNSTGTGLVGGTGFGTPPPVVMVKPEPPKPAAPAHISSGVIAGNKIAGSDPMYPAIAKAAHVSGAVVLRAVISKAGSIQSLAVVSGPDMLRASAVAAVQAWRYRPYLLNGEPTEVDTTITVNFSFGG